MLHKISSKILECLIKNNAVKKEQKAIVLFGIEQGLTAIAEIAIMLFTGLLINVFWQSVIILLAFIPIRVYAGGYHAKTPMQCVLKSWALFTAVLLWMKYIPDNIILQIAVLIVTGIWMFCFCPIQDVHKPLRENEKSKYKFKAFRNFFVDVCVFGIGYFADIQTLSRCIALGNFMLLVMLIAGTFKNAKKMDNVS